MTGSIKMCKLDYLTMKTQTSSYFALGFIIILFSCMNASIISLTFSTSWFTAMLSNQIFMIHEKGDLGRFYHSLSLELKDIVQGRYLFLFTNYFICLLLTLIIGSIFALYRHTPLAPLDLLTATASSLLVFTVINGVQLPLYFKFGYTKAKISSLLAPLIVIAIFYCGTSGILPFLYSPSLFIILSFLLSILIIMISCHLSVFGYKTGKR